GGSDRDAAGSRNGERGAHAVAVGDNTDRPLSDGQGRRTALRYQRFPTDRLNDPSSSQVRVRLGRLGKQCSPAISGSQYQRSVIGPFPARSPVEKGSQPPLAARGGGEGGRRCSCAFVGLNGLSADDSEAMPVKAIECRIAAPAAGPVVQ